MNAEGKECSFNIEVQGAEDLVIAADKKTGNKSYDSTQDASPEMKRAGSQVLLAAVPNVLPSLLREESKKDGSENRFQFGKWKKLLWKRGSKAEKAEKAEKEHQIIKSQLLHQTRQKVRPHTSDHQDMFLRMARIAEEIRRTEPIPVVIHSTEKPPGKWHTKRHPVVNMDEPALRLKLIYRHGMRIVDRTNRRNKDNGRCDVKEEVVKIGRKAIESFDARTGMDVSDLASLDPYTFCVFHVKPSDTDQYVFQNYAPTNERQVDASTSLRD